MGICFKYIALRITLGIVQLIKHWLWKSMAISLSPIIQTIWTLSDNGSHFCFASRELGFNSPRVHISHLFFFS